MKIINPDIFFDYPITVDSTRITVDNTITVDTVSIDSGNLYIEIQPRDYVDEVTITFYNKLKQTTHTEQCYTYIRNNWMTVPFTFKDFEEGDSLEIRVYRLDGKLIKLEQGLVTRQDNLENYQLTQPNNIGRIRL